ncbi:MAG: deoxyguanosinetriphosphate triphosphohydrolase [Rhodospirillaceae bacterium]|jgi:dGTPase|nr:deoxyguanosinetriphosphate triphosphohydrolase [Rhodospirillaceae bacterium]
MLVNCTLVPYACHSSKSQGRYYSEPLSETRSPFQRDRDRIIHSEAFRKLKYKTQVFIYHKSNNFRTRLTHSLEVSQIARSISRVLGLNEDLTEVLSLAHDLGHAPFGHAGECALQDMTKDIGGFDHNIQSVRIVTKLEHRYCQFDGLNLSWETIDGMIKHNGPLTRFVDIKSLPLTIADCVIKGNLEFNSFASAEAQVASLSDDIAYNNHDIDDGLRAGLFNIDDLKNIPFVGEVFSSVKYEFPNISQSLHIHEAVRRLIGLMVSDLINETRRRIAKFSPVDCVAICRLNEPLVAFTPTMRENNATIKKFLFHNMYRHYKVNKIASKARRIIKDLYSLFIEEPECLPPELQIYCDGKNNKETARTVTDYIAGMTDHNAIEEHNNLFGFQEKL